MISSDQYISSLLIKYKSKGILIDANLLLLYFVGSYDPRRIDSFERTKSSEFTLRDFEILMAIFDFFKKVVTTPNILTEVSNLSGNISSWERYAYYSVFAERVSGLAEEYVSSAGICALEHFKSFGLTDSGIIEMVKGKYLVLSDDAPLVAYLQNVGLDAIHFRNVRESVGNS